MDAISTRTGFAALRERLQDRQRTDLPAQIEALGWSAERIAEVRRARLRALLGHAVEHSPFHARRLAGIDLDAVEPGDLTRLPVMTKAELMAAYGDVVTDRRLTRRSVEEAIAATRTEPVPLFDAYIAMASGGSSGLRGVFLFDMAALSAFFGGLTRAAIARLRARDAIPPGGLPMAMVAAGTAVHATGCAAPFTANGAFPLRVVPVPVSLPFGEIVARLEEIGAPGLYGYPSVLARLAAERRAGRLRLSPMIVTSTSETLTPQLRAAISAGFEAPVVDTFGSTEGLVGTSPPDDDVIVLNSDQCVVELVDDDLRPVPPGTPSTRVLVTNLVNHLQPLVRYELTDSFVAVEPDPAHGHQRVRVRGRIDPTFRFGDTEVPPGVIRGVLLRRPEIVEYQVCQRDHGITVDAVLAAGTTLDRDCLAERLAAALAGTGLHGATADVRVVGGLTRDAQTGKVRRFVPAVRG
ncbi:hypothetical protein ACFQ34_05710 [Pseudonocardia benzenivorans]|uniref:Phenylacetate-CoA ligase n=1 Tax=Pseudonocardia benzenivorans TaxID=228005 RepID=A0ABW3VD00_9PSEU